eukprot:CAMPEP_0170569482 /NCGR_PEP_ID=MMETSP0224-20130122/575_1 /TAXON_ID=285029 /ORGANISM="Togula jolla, Strain CCCM 725" /LENGTH=378 /DNA_ID=CAMNT_0010891645 /DNA_START=560 /DNA_END=1696 /DNA_ORIENTATION=+
MQVSAGRYQCDSCHAFAWKAQEDLKAAQIVAREQRITRKNSMDYRLEWRPELVPCSRRALQDLGVPETRLPPGQLVLCHDAATGGVTCASAPRAVPDAAVNISYLAAGLRILQEFRREPRFSLDPKDKREPSGDLQVKRFIPPVLARTVLGEVLFQADYALKELCFQERIVPWLPLPNLFQETSENFCAARLWFVVRSAGVTRAADGVLVPHLEMGVDARRLTVTADGYTDAPYTDPNDPVALVAKVVTQYFHRVAEHLPAVAELMAVTKAMILARYLLESGCRLDEPVLRNFRLPSCPEGSDYAMEIPTLRKAHRAASVLDQDGQLVLRKQERSLHGGVDLGLPSKKVPVRAAPPLLEQGCARVALPLFAQPAARAA